LFFFSFFFWESELSELMGVLVNVLKVV
jgi:hypothetical protein